MLRIALFAVFCATIAAPAFAAGPTIDIVIAENAKFGENVLEVETFPATEMAAQLKKLFAAEVRIHKGKPPADAQHIIYLGESYNHPVGDKIKWPEPHIGTSGQWLKSLEVDGKPALIVAGAGRAATLWAAYELGWHFGIRYFPFGDLYPINNPQFSLQGIDLRFPRPTQDPSDLQQGSAERFWFSNIAGPLGPEVWSADELLQKRRYFAAAKFNRIYFKTPNDWNLTPHQFPVSGETIGRAAFRGAKYFANPDIPTDADPQARLLAISQLGADVFREAEKFSFQYRHGGRDAKHVNLLPCMLHNVLHQRYLASPKTPPTVYIDFACLDDAALATVYVRRRAFDKQATPAQVCEEWLTPVLGPEVHVNVMKAFDLCEKASLELEKYPDFQTLNEELFRKHFQSDEPPPAWWSEARTNYLNAMNEMYRANTRAREGGRAFTLYYARRFEFGFEYLNAVEAVRNAGIAKRKGDNETQIAELEKAIDSVTNACNAMAAVARSQSDRGVIAVMNAYGYRPLLKLLEEADAGN